MPAGLPAPPSDPAEFVRVESPPLTLWLERKVWDDAMRRKGHLIVSMGEYGRFRLRLEGADEVHDEGAP